MLGLYLYYAAWALLFFWPIKTKRLFTVNIDGVES